MRFAGGIICVFSPRSETDVGRSICFRRGATPQIWPETSWSFRDLPSSAEAAKSPRGHVVAAFSSIVEANVRPPAESCIVLLSYQTVPYVAGTISGTGPRSTGGGHQTDDA